MGNLKNKIKVCALGLSAFLLFGGCGGETRETFFYDLNGDNKPDFVYFVRAYGGCISGRRRYEVRVRLNNGDGTFGEEQILSSTIEKPRGIEPGSKKE